MPIFNAAERRLCQDTWDVIAEDLAGNAMTMFVRMFTVNGEMKELYPFLSDYSGKLEDCQQLKVHVMRVFKKFDLVISQLDTPAIMHADLKNLGSRHPGYNVNPNKHAQPTGDALMFMLSKVLGDKWTPEAKSAWGKCWTDISNCMLG